MNRRSIITIIVLIFVLLSIYWFYNQKLEETVNKEIPNTFETTDKKVYNSNLIKNVEYSSEDLNGNKYMIFAEQGEIDINNNNIIFLKKVRASVDLKDSSRVLISSDYAKYNIINFDTIFSKNISINYLKNMISSDYLDFSIERNSMIISKNVVYTDQSNTLKTDVIEVDLETKNTKFYMHHEKDKVEINKLK